MEVWLAGEGGVAHQLLDVEATLKNNLMNTTLLEYPCLLVVSKGVGAPGLLKSEKDKDRGTLSSGPAHIHTGNIVMPTDSVEQRCEEEWSDRVLEEGEVVEDMCPSASLKLIATMYSDSDDSND